MKALAHLACALAILLWATGAQAQLVPPPPAAPPPATVPGPADTLQVLANQPLFPNIRAGTLGVPSMSGGATVGAQTAIRIDGSTPVIDLFAHLGNVRLGERVLLSAFAESAQLDAPHAAFNPGAPMAPNPLPTIETQSFQAIGIRFRIRLNDLDPGYASRCYQGVNDVRSPPLPRAQWRNPVNPLTHGIPSDCPLPASLDTADVHEYFYRLRQREQFGGTSGHGSTQLFLGARYLYRGTAKADASASGAAFEAGLLHLFEDDWMMFGSASVVWLAQSQSPDTTGVVVLPESTEVRATFGVGWRPTYNPTTSLTLGFQGTASWNFWRNDFAQGAQDRAIHGRAIEASLFANGHFGTSFNGFFSLGVHVPYGGDDTPRLVFTLAPAVAAPAPSDSTNGGH